MEHNWLHDCEKFHRIDEEKSYVVMVSGPGVLTVRMHRLLDPEKLAQPGYDKGCTFVIFENDVLLQQLRIFQ